MLAENRAFTTPKLYDQLSLRMIPYNEVAAFIKGKIDHYLSGATSVLDLACGTGNLTLELARLGYEVSGLDAALPMLEEARAKTEVAGLAINYSHQDMTAFSVEGQVDVITCFYTALNYLNSLEQLEKCFAQVFAALKPGGLFVFDQFTPAKMRRLFNGVDGGDLGNFYIVTHSKFEDGGQINHEITYFLHEENGCYRRVDEFQHLRSHEFEELEKLLAKAGLTLLEKEEIYPAGVSYRGFREGFLFVARKAVTDVAD
jgi:SAM-dependent methyltransferase